MGFVTGEIDVTCSLFWLMRTLSEEQLMKVCVTSEEISGAEVKLWLPSQDPRPAWLVYREEKQELSSYSVSKSSQNEISEDEFPGKLSYIHGCQLQDEKSETQENNKSRKHHTV